MRLRRSISNLGLLHNRQKAPIYGPFELSRFAEETILNAVNAYFVTYTLGTTLAEGQSSGGGAGEHMTSFDYAYKLEAVRDWLFAQSK